MCFEINNTGFDSFTAKLDIYWVVGEKNDPTLLGGPGKKRYWFQAMYMVEVINGNDYVVVEEECDLSVFDCLWFETRGNC